MKNIVMKEYRKIATFGTVACVHMAVMEIIRRSIYHTHKMESQYHQAPPMFGQ